jgi:hypothetical protein
MSTRQLDFDLHGVIGIRVIDAGPREADTLHAQLGGMVQPLDRVPDITVRFLPHFSPRNLRYIEIGKTGFTDTDFFLLSHRRRPVLVRMPFDAADGPCEIECAHGVGSVPLLAELIMLTAVRKGYAPVHASAFEYQGSGVLVAGWAHGGKTSCLLAFAQAGARFISDDLVLLRGDGSRLLGLPTTISVADWQLDQIPAVRGRAGAIRRSLFAGTRMLARLQPVLGDKKAGRVLHAVLPALQRRLKVDLFPEMLFGPVGECFSNAGTVFLTLSQAAPEIRVEPADPATVADQLATLFRAQLHGCFELYHAYRFAFPNRKCDLLENAVEDAASLLRQALLNKRVFTVRHPHPVSLQALRFALEPHITHARAEVAVTAGEA